VGVWAALGAKKPRFPAAVHPPEQKNEANALARGIVRAKNHIGVVEITMPLTNRRITGQKRNSFL